MTSLVPQHLPAESTASFDALLLKQLISYNSNCPGLFPSPHFIAPFTELPCFIVEVPGIVAAL